LESREKKVFLLIAAIFLALKSAKTSKKTFFVKMVARKVVEINLILSKKISVIWIF